MQHYSLRIKSVPSTCLNSSQYWAKIHHNPYFRHTKPAEQFLATVAMKKRNVLLIHWLSFYTDEHQKNVLTAHKLIKTAELVEVF